MKNRDALFPVGRVVGLHGLRGEIKVRPQTNSPDLLLGIKRVLIRLKDGHQLEARVRAVRLDRRLIMISLQDYPDRTAVEPLADAELFVQREEVGSLGEDEWWVPDLIGLPVYTTDGTMVGAVSSIIYGANQLLEISVKEGGATILVPFVKALVPVVDLKAGRIEVVDIPGLLEPQ